VKAGVAVGDFIWIAQRTVPQYDEFDEIVLDYIVERKRADDLVSSILDGRYKEQKVSMCRDERQVTNYIRTAESDGKVWD
jgi:ERCC4-type nuclease